MFFKISFQEHFKWYLTVAVASKYEQLCFLQYVTCTRRDVQYIHL